MPSPAPCCIKALDDATARWPGRSRASDGIMGDLRHQTRKSDHNDGNAFDLTHDPVHGVDCDVLSRAVIKDPRVTYVIWNRRIYNRARAAEGWRPYGGANPHTKHMHVSIRSDARDNLAPWPWSGMGPIEKGDWFSMATAADLERVVRKVLNEGTAFGQKNWAGTSKATLGSIQSGNNLLRQQVIPKLNSLIAASTVPATDPTQPSAGTVSSASDASGEAPSADEPPPDSGEPTEPVPDDTTEPIDVDVPPGALAALSELYRTLSPEQASILASLFAALGPQDDAGE